MISLYSPPVISIFMLPLTDWSRNCRRFSCLVESSHKVSTQKLPCPKSNKSTNEMAHTLGQDFIMP